MKKVLLGLVILLVLYGVGSAIGADKDENPESKADHAATTPKVASTKGKQPMRWGNWELVGKITVEKGFNQEFDPDFAVKNTGKESDAGYFKVKFLKGGTVLGTATCTTDLSLAAEDVPPGQEGLVKCDSSDDFTTGWTEITIQNGDAF